MSENMMNEDYSLSFDAEEDKVGEDITKELTEEIDSALWQKNFLDQMTHQLNSTSTVSEEVDEKNEEIVEEVIAVEKVSTKGSSISERDFSYLNNGLLELNKKTKDIAVLYIVLKQKMEKLEKKEHGLNELENELKEIISHIKSERRYHDLTDVDFNEIIKRVETKIKNKGNKNTKIHFSKKSKNIFLKTFLLISVMALLLTGYAYKTNQENDTSVNVFKNLLTKIIN